jgi:hypothetical protein
MAVAAVPSGSLRAEGVIPELIRKSKTSVVCVESLRSRVKFAIGSGFVVGDGSLVVTNRHVVQGADSVEIVQSDGKRATVTGFVSLPESRDLIVLKLTAALATPPMKLASKRPDVGQTVIAIGNPVGYSFTATKGIVSAWRTGAEVNTLLKAKVAPETDAVMQTDASISHGSSGGPLLNEAGEVVAVTSWGDPHGQNINLCMPAEYVEEALGAVLADVRPIKSLPGATLALVKPPSTVFSKKYTAKHIELKILEIKRTCECPSCKGTGIATVWQVVGDQVVQVQVPCTACDATGLRLEPVTYKLLSQLAEYCVFVLGSDPSAPRQLAAAQDIFAKVAVDRTLIANAFSARACKDLANAGVIECVPMVFYGDVLHVFHDGITKYYRMRVYGSGIDLIVIRPGWATAVKGDYCIVGGVALGAFVTEDERGGFVQEILVHAAAAERIRRDR